jgi:hypothetical protein|tara:strand:+ start:9 stop:284 length:276 start_codon:yes stop_codon:yes gene_type:complete
MIDFKIDSGIAVPIDFHTSTRKYPFEEMSAGDSFFVGPNYDDETQKQIGNRVAQARQTYQKRCVRQGNEVTFTQRQWTEQDVRGYRVWRVK